MSTITAQATNNSDFKKLLSTMKGHLLFGTSHASIHRCGWCTTGAGGNGIR